MEQGPLGLNPELRTPPLPATHVRAGTDHRVLARNYTTDQGRPSCLRVHSLRATSCRNCYLPSTLITGCPAAMCSSAAALMWANWASRSGWLPPSIVLALPCRLKFSSRSRPATVGADTVWPCPESSSASRRRLLVVHRSGDSGSPRDSGSTRASSATLTPGSVLVTLLRPPPVRRVRPNGSSPASSSRTPPVTVTLLTPAARATTATPPWPSMRASAPIINRR